MSPGKPAGQPVPSEPLPRAIVDLQDRVSRCATIGELLSVLATGLRPLLPVTDRASLVLLEPDGEWLRIYRLLPPLDAPPDPLPRVRVEGTPVGRVVREGIGRVVADVRADPNITFGHASHDRIRSTVSAPIRVGGRVIGALNTGSRTPGACTEQMLREFEELVSVVGPAIYAAETALRTGGRAAHGDTRDGGGRDADTEGAPEVGLVGQSAAFRALLEAARRAAETDVPILITGETGVGKTALARAVHEWSTRRSGPFVTVQLADLASSLVESELFGHERGAFTGALTSHAGRFESAQGGTIFLDEVAEADPSIQSKLLRVIQSRCFERVGSNRTIRTDARLIAATSRDLREAMARGHVRADLYYRLNVLPLHVPALRDRTDDLEPLARAILVRIAAAGGGPPRRLSPGAWERLRGHAWPGNIRELESVLRRAAILEDGEELHLRGFPDEPKGDSDGDSDGDTTSDPDWPTLEEHQRRYIRRVLQSCGGVIEGAGGAAQKLGLRPSTLRSRMNKLELSAQSMRGNPRRK